MTEAKERKVHTPEFKAFTPRNASRPTFDREYTRHPFYGSRRMVVYLRREGTASIASGCSA